MRTLCHARTPLLLALALLLLGSGTAHAAAKWTILAYLAARNNLEIEMVGNVQEMARVGSTADVNIVVQLSRGYPVRGAVAATVPGLSYFTGVKRLLIQKDKAVELQDLGDLDLRQAAALGDFIDWGIKNYPADHYAVILSDHGESWRGCCQDSSRGDMLMPLSAIAAGLLRGVPAGQPLDLLGFDACLMASVEVAHALQPFARLLVASEDLEPGAGWDWEAWLKPLVADPSVTAVTVGRDIVDTYRARHMMDPLMTLSVTDLGQIPALESALGALAGSLGGNLSSPDTWTAVAKAREGALEFGAEGPSSPGVSLDLGQFLQGIARAEPDLQPQVQPVVDALDNTVIYNATGQRNAAAQGLSIYLPPRTVDPNYSMIAFPSVSPWGRFVTAYTTTAQADADAPAATDVTLVVAAADTQLMARSAARDLAEADVVLAAQQGDERVFLGALPVTASGGALSYAYDGRWPLLGDGTTEIPAALFPTDPPQGGQAVDAIPAEVDLDGSGQFIPATLLFTIDLQARSGQLLGAFEEGGELDLSDASARVRPMRVLVTDAGPYRIVPGTVTLAASALQLRLATPSPAMGALQLGFRLRDLAGNTTTTLTALSSAPSGCGCTVEAAAPPPPTTGLVVLLALAALAVVRRAHRRSPAPASAGVRSERTGSRRGG